MTENPDQKRNWRRIKWVAGVLAAVVIGSLLHDRFVMAPERRQLLRRYHEFRVVVATHDAERILQLVAPEFRPWAVNRLHLYETFAIPLTDRSTISIHSRSAAICPIPQKHFLVIPGGHTIEMVKHDGQWLMGRVSID